MDDSDPCGGPPPSLPEQIAAQFYDWEVPCRGWHVDGGPIGLEPPFRPFVGYVRREVPTDDGQRHTVLSGAIDWLHRKWHGLGSAAPAGEAEVDEEEGPARTPWKDPSGLVELELSLPADLDAPNEVAEQMLLSLSSCEFPLAFEIVGLPAAVVVQLVCADADAAHVRQQIEAYFPEMTLTAHRETLAGAWNGAAGGETVIAEFGLGREFMLPLATSRTFAVDPLVGVVAALANAGPGEVAVLQVLFQPVRHPWAESVLRSVTFADGSPVFEGLRDFVGQARRKISRPLHGAVVRVAARSQGDGHAWEMARQLCGALAPLADPDGNELFPVDNEGYELAEHAEDLLLRRSRRSGMLLNSEELTALVHPPSASVRTAKLRGSSRKTKCAPAIVLGHPLVLGQNEHAGIVSAVTLSPDQRAKHMHVVGASGTGKSTLLLNMIVQDIRQGQGVAVLDPHGDLIDAVLRHIPRKRIDDVVLVDPADEDFPVGFNVLSAHSALEKNLLASDLVAVFRRLSTSWGDQMNAVFGNAILAFLESSRGGTLVDLRRFLVEPAFRNEFLSSVQDPEVVYYWKKEFPLLRGRPQSPVLTRLDTFLRPKPIRYMVSQKESRLDFAEIMDGSRIFLARLSHGVVGEENAFLLGTLLVSKFHQLALTRQRLEETARQYFWLYIDEFQNFATPSMAAILSGVRKYRLGLVLAHQEIRQLESQAPEVAGAVIANAYTRVCFRLGDDDARRFADGFASFEAQDLQNLATGEAICRTERADADFNLRVSRAPADESDAAEIVTDIIRLSRQRYAVARSAVEAELAKTYAGTRDESQLLKQIELKPAAAAVEPPAITVPAPRPGGDAPATTPKKTSKIAMAEPVLPGRGGPEHKYLQQFIKQCAEGMGYRASVEETVLGTCGIDVALRKGETSIACEICITTDDTHELGNVRKCLEGGYQYVAVVSPQATRLDKLTAAIVGRLADGERQRVHFFLPDQLISFIQELEIKNLEQEKTVRGYRIKTSFRAPPREESRGRRQVVSEVVAKAMKRLRDKSKSP
jgi:hypothetical protein